MILTMGGFYLKASESYDVDGVCMVNLLLKGDTYNEVDRLANNHKTFISLCEIIEVLRGPLIDEVV